MVNNRYFPAKSLFFRKFCEDRLTNKWNDQWSRWNEINENEVEYSEGDQNWNGKCHFVLDWWNIEDYWCEDCWKCHLTYGIEWLRTLTKHHAWNHKVDSVEQSFPSDLNHESDIDVEILPAASRVDLLVSCWVQFHQIPLQASESDRMAKTPIPWYIRIISTQVHSPPQKLELSFVVGFVYNLASSCLQKIVRTS